MVERLDLQNTLPLTPRHGARLPGFVVRGHRQAVPLLCFRLDERVLFRDAPERVRAQRQAKRWFRCFRQF
jgi:hypothetical protein